MTTELEYLLTFTDRGSEGYEYRYWVSPYYGRWVGPDSEPLLYDPDDWADLAMAMFAYAYASELDDWGDDIADLADYVTTAHLRPVWVQAGWCGDPDCDAWQCSPCEAELRHS